LLGETFCIVLLDKNSTDFPAIGELTINVVMMRVTNLQYVILRFDEKLHTIIQPHS
jgi:hypothetical protein